MDSFTKKPLIIVAIVGVLLFCCVISLFFGFKIISDSSGSNLFGSNSSSGSNKIQKVNETKSSLATIKQAYVSINAFGADSTGGTKIDSAVIQYAPLVNITTTKEITKFEIMNVKLTNPIKAQKSLVSWPKHYKYGQDSNTFYESMGTNFDYVNRKDEGNSFSYNVVDVAGYSDEIGKNGGYVDFRYTVFGIGNKIDYQGIMNTQHIYSGGKELQYAGIKAGEINSPIEFDVVVTFKDKSQAVKHFSLTSDFNEIYNQGFSFTYNSKDYEGKSF